MMRIMKPVVSVVIGTYNQRDVLQRVLTAYNTQSAAIPFEVIVVDSSSTDGTLDMLGDFHAKFTLRHIVQANAGKAAARNRGVHDAKADIIVVTDADMVPHERFVQTHFEAHRGTQQAKCFEGLTYNLKRLHWPPEPDLLHPYMRYQPRPGAELGWFYFLTGNLSFPKSVFLEAGGFSPDFTGYGWEDLELGYRLYKDGVPLVYLPTAINYHYHVVTDTDEIQRNVAKGQSAKIFLKKHPELRWFLGLNPLSVFVYRATSPRGILYRLMEKATHLPPSNLFHRLGIWFLKEYHYLSGALS
jgi:GT2 family glycosyltransferase